MLKLGNTDINALGNNINKAYLGTIEVFGNVLTSLWQTTTANETITLPTPTNYRVDWGDGTVTTNTNSHEYLVANQYTIKISGHITDWTFFNFIQKTSLLNISEYGGLNLILGAFSDGINLNITATKQPRLTDTLSFVFNGCNSLVYNSSISNWDTSGVNSMISTFQESTNFNQPLNWDTSSVTNMPSMFNSCTNFNQPLNFDTSSVIDMSFMFREALAFNSSVVFSDTSKVTNMSNMFRLCSNFNQPLNFDTSSVLNMKEMFRETVNFNSPIYFSDTSKVTDMTLMFYVANIFNQPLNFDTSSVTNMTSILFRARGFNQPLNWDTSKVTNMSSALRETLVFNQDISNLSFASVTNMSNFMSSKGAEYDVNYMDNLYIKLDQDLIFANMVDINISFGSINYTSAGATARASLVSKGFIITSGIQV